MSIIFPLTTFILMYTGVLLLLRRSLTHILFGVMLLSHAVNMIVFSSRGIVIDGIPILHPDHVGEMVADPLPQALVLTAIVISFGVFAFFITLFLRSSQGFESDDTKLMRDEHDS